MSNFFFFIFSFQIFLLLLIPIINLDFLLLIWDQIESFDTLITIKYKSLKLNLDIWSSELELIRYTYIRINRDKDLKKIKLDVSITKDQISYLELLWYSVCWN